MELPCEDEYAPNADPASPHVLEREAVVELVEVCAQRPGVDRVMVVLVNQLAELLDSPTAPA